MMGKFINFLLIVMIVDTLRGEIIVSEKIYYVNSPLGVKSLRLIKATISSLNHKIWYRQGEDLSHRF